MWNDVVRREDVGVKFARKGQRARRGDDFGWNKREKGEKMSEIKNFICTFAH